MQAQELARDIFSVPSSNGPGLPPLTEASYVDEETLSRLFLLSSRMSRAVPVSVQTEVDVERGSISMTFEEHGCAADVMNSGQGMYHSIARVFHTWLSCCCCRTVIPSHLNMFNLSMLNNHQVCTTEHNHTLANGIAVLFIMQLWFSPFTPLTVQSVSYLVQGISEVYGQYEDEVLAVVGQDGLGAAQGSLGPGGGSGEARDARLGQVSAAVPVTCNSMSCSCTAHKCV